MAERMTAERLAEIRRWDANNPHPEPGTCAEQRHELLAEVDRLTAERDAMRRRCESAWHQLDVVGSQHVAARARLRAMRQRVLALADRMDALYDQGYTITDGDAGEGADALPERVRADMLDAPRRLPALIRAAVNGPPEQAEGARWKATRSNTDLYEGDCPDGTRCDRPCRDQCDRLIAEECGGNTAAPPTTGEVASG
jgi:hypothetical protein